MAELDVQAMAKVLYIAAHWQDTISEPDGQAKPQSEYERRAAERWDTGKAGWSNYQRYPRYATALSAAGFGLVADAKAGAKRDAAAAGVRAVCDVWGAGGRATVRLSELSEIAKDITEGEWDQHIEWNLKDIARERARATKAAS